MSQIEDLIKETRAAFIIAKSDGVLDSSEIIQIAVELAQKIGKLVNLSGSEKKSILLHALKKGLDDSGGLDSLTAFASASPDAKAALQEQLLSAASVSVDLVLSAASGKLDLRSPMKWLPSCCTAVQALLPKDLKLVEDAKKFSEKIMNKDLTTEDVVTFVNEEATNAVPALASVKKVVDEKATEIKKVVSEKVTEVKKVATEKVAEVKKTVEEKVPEVKKAVVEVKKVVDEKKADVKKVVEEKVVPL